MKEKTEVRRTAVIGAGSWGTALAKMLGDKGLEVLLHGHRPEHVAALRRDRENRRYLPGHALPATVALVDDAAQAAAASACVLMVVPSHGYRAAFAALAPALAPGTLVMSAVKGVEIGSRQTMVQVMCDVLEKQGIDTPLHLGVLSGPSFAAEVAAGQPTAVTVAFPDHEAAVAAQRLLATDFFRAYTSSDVVGLEISGAMKNVIAIAAGISDGLGFGLNTRAALITRGLAEITRLGVHFGAHPLTFSGLGGLGDLVLTCTGSLSRNRTVGLKLGQGKTLEQALDEMTMVAEGVKTTRSCYNLARANKVEMPILEQVYAVLYEDKSAAAAVRDLLRRDLRKELE